MSAKVAIGAGILAIAAGCVLAAGCAVPDGLHASSDRTQVVTTTGILADLARNVAGERADVVPLVPDGADPHTYEPSLRDVRDVVYADVAFSNYLLLEEQSIITALDANLRHGVPSISLAEESIKYAAELIPLVEDVSLDTVWLGLRVRGDGDELGADRSSSIRLAATDVRGPGHMYAYLTGSFGRPEIYIDSSDGFDRTTGYDGDAVVLPPDAHTHMSWAFTEPGVYQLDLAATLQTSRTEPPRPAGAATVTFAVGVDAHAARPSAQIIDAGHADITVDLDGGKVLVVHDPEGGGEATRRLIDPADAVIGVPSSALHEVPPDPSMRFLGRSGELVHQLPQAVLGRHVHGEIDPHLWQDVGNAIAYVQIIRDQLVAVDPGGAADYRHNTDRYLSRLVALDDEVRSTIAEIPEARRRLVTTHDAFGYLAHAYDLDIAGFVTPNPAAEPSLLDRRRLAATIDQLGIPAVFLEPNLIARSSTLTEIAADHGVRVCPIYGDTFDEHVHTYIQMMRANARSLRRCLS